MQKRPPQSDTGAVDFFAKIAMVIMGCMFSSVASFSASSRLVASFSTAAFWQRRSC